MKLLQGVSVEQENEHLIIKTPERYKVVKQEYEYILRALLDGIEEEEELFHVVMEKEKLNRAAAGFTLADFLLEYADFIQREGSDPELID